MRGKSPFVCFHSVSAVAESQNSRTRQIAPTGSRSSKRSCATPPDPLQIGLRNEATLLRVIDRFAQLPCQIHHAQAPAAPLPAACSIPNATPPFCRSQSFEEFFNPPCPFPFIALQTSRPFPHPGFSTLPRYREAEVGFDTI